MRRFIILAVASILWLAPCRAQEHLNYWEPVPMEGFSIGGWPIKTYYDPNSNDVYIFGITYSYATETMPSGRSLQRFNGSNFETVATASSDIRAICIYQGHLYAAGFFNRIGNDSVYSLARMEGNSWVAIGSPNNFVTALKVINDTLYVGGSFAPTENFPFHYVAKFDGQTWHSVPSPAITSNPGHIWAINFYNDEVYLAGNFQSPNGQDIQVLRNGQWQQVGEGVSGLATTVRYLEVYQGHLYAAGGILASAGNVSNHIIRWNGEVWEPVLGEVQFLTPGGGVGNIRGITNLNGYLYITGGFLGAGGIAARNLARFDGQQWCAFHTEDAGPQINSHFVYGDTVYIQGSTSLDGWLVHGTYFKWIGGENYSICSEPIVSVEESTVQNALNVFPNPTHHHLYLEGLEEGKAYTAQVVSITGQVVQRNLTVQNQQAVDVRSLAPGLYLLVLDNEHGQRQVVRFVRE